MKILLLYLLALSAVAAESFFSRVPDQSTKNFRRMMEKHFKHEKSSPPWVVALIYGPSPARNKFREYKIRTGILDISWLTELDLEYDTYQQLAKAAAEQFICSGTLISWTFVISGNVPY